jgi:hypothetical protein
MAPLGGRQRRRYRRNHDRIPQTRVLAHRLVRAARATRARFRAVRCAGPRAARVGHAEREREEAHRNRDSLSRRLQQGKFGPLVLAAFAFLATVIWACLWCPGKLTKQAPGPKWGFGSSWTTNLTAVGATLGTVLGAATLPDVPSQIDKDTFVQLNLGFGLLVVIAPFLFHALRWPIRKTAMDDNGLYGGNVTLLVACCLTFAAVLGELATLALLSGSSLAAAAMATSR